MIETNVLNALRDAKVNYDAAVRSNMNVTAKRQILTNILLSHAGELIDTALDAENFMKKEIENKREIAELRKTIDEYTAEKNPTNDNESAAPGGKRGR